MDYNTSTHNTPPQPPKKKKKGAGVIIAVVAIILVLAIAVTAIVGVLVVGGVALGLYAKKNEKQPVNKNDSQMVLDSSDVVGNAEESHSHNYYEYGWCSDENYHWLVCGCGEKSNYENHNFGDWVTVNEATCTETGSEKRYCNDCGYEQHQTVPETGHALVTIEGKAATCANDGFTEGEKCMSCGTVTKTQEVIPATGEHVYNFGTCIYCGSTNNTQKESVGLSFTQNSDGTYCVAGLGTCSDADIVIPATYRGKKVTSIAENAFENCVHITSVVIPDSVTEIGNRAFYNCDGMASVNIPKGMTAINNEVFRGCDGITVIHIPANIQYIGASAFYNSDFLVQVIFENPDGWYVTNNTDYTGGTYFNAYDSEYAAQYMWTEYNFRYYRK